MKLTLHQQSPIHGPSFQHMQRGTQHAVEVQVTSDEGYLELDEALSSWTKPYR